MTVGILKSKRRIVIIHHDTNRRNTTRVERSLRKTAISQEKQG
ncbi:MAG: hypothetical protein ANABAC_1362 [Anaerolineae bacterium]|nr:MAG: hypothetical protein ANABAC_1362 [Anaerolineae bacterium]